MKEEDLNFEVIRDFIIEMKYYTIQNYLKNCMHVDCMFLSCHVGVSEWIHTL